jgi:hypothetical protein
MDFVIIGAYAAGMSAVSHLTRKVPVINIIVFELGFKWG